MRLPKVIIGFILPLWLGMAAFGAARQQEEKKPEDNRPAQPAARPQEQPKPKPQAQPRTQEQPRAQGQQRTQPQPKPQAQPRQQTARPQEQPRAQEQQRTQPQPKPQAQPRQQTARPQEQPNAQERQRTQPQPKPQEQPRQQTARPQEQARPNANAAPSGSSSGRQQQARPSQPNDNRGGGNTREAGGRPQQSGGGHQNTQQRARSQEQARNFAAAKRVPQTQERTIFQQRRASNWGSDHRDWRARGGYVGFRIPDARFGLYFGRTHFFHLWGLPMVYVGGYPEFQYRGYWFELLDPVPPDWAPDWFQTDQVYIDWDSEYGGYYLYDARYPDERLAVEIAG